MPLRLYNSLTKKDEDVIPQKKKEITMYTCGPTVYGRPHIGNYSSFLMADLLRRWLEVGHGLSVKHVKNITDVGHLVADADSGEDKVEKQAKIFAKEKRGESAVVTHDDVIAVARMYEEQYVEDEKNLRFLEPFARPRASEYVEQMKEMITQLLKDGHAYAVSDGIYFDVTSKLKTPYGTLSGNKLEDLNAGSRVEVKEEKHHPADFALWKFCVGFNEHHFLRWESPASPTGEKFPEGFPGWHIECSAMSRSLLGDTIDIHTGGEDNIFPHHECEIAQSESVTGKQFVKLWLHKRRIQMGEKSMSKSLGNVLTIPDMIAKGYSPMDVRYYFLSVHYRTQLKFSEEGLEGAKKERTRIVEWFTDIRRRASNAQLSYEELAASNASCEALEKFKEAMDDDLNTSNARAVIFEGMTNYFKYTDTGGELNHQQLKELATFAELVSKTFGCFDIDDESIPEDVQALIDERAAARNAKDFAASDRLREAIFSKGYEVKDVKEGQRIRKL